MAMTPGMKMLMMAKTAQGGRTEREYSAGMDDRRMGVYDRMPVQPEMRRKRDDRGRYMSGNAEYRMGNDHSTRMMADDNRDDAPEMCRRRADRGRYMVDDDGPRMAYGAAEAYRPWPGPHTPPHLNDRRRMDTDPQQMRDKNIVNIRDYQDRRKVIGFEQEGGDPRRMHSGHTPKVAYSAGGAESRDRLTRDKAEKWVKSMHGSDPKVRGEMWSYDDAKVLAEERGIPTEGQDMLDYYVVLNMVYNDYAKVAKDHGVDTEGYFADLACAWLYDPDGKPPAEKLMAYKQYVIPHGEE